jgi:hypothetical protein
VADNICACCGEIIPEGMIACPNCLVVSKRQATENNKFPCNQICVWNDPSDGCVKPEYADCGWED